MSDNASEKRREQRVAANGLFRIYTSVTCCAYTVPLKDVSKGGVFIKTPHLPMVGEVITYVVLDHEGKERLVGNATVRWVNDKEYKGEVGFGIELNEQLAEDIIDELKA